jgi:hypothetical protein
VITFDVEPEDGEQFEVKADSRDVVVWEKTSRTNERYLELISNMRMSAMYRLCHIAARRQGLVDCKLDEFEKDYILHFATEDVVTPTQAEVSNEE